MNTHLLMQGSCIIPRNWTWLQVSFRDAGKTAGMGLLLRSSPYHGARRRSYIPLETAAKVRIQNFKNRQSFICVETLSLSLSTFHKSSRIRNLRSFKPGFPDACSKRCRFVLVTWQYGLAQEEMYRGQNMEALANAVHEVTFLGIPTCAWLLILLFMSFPSLNYKVVLKQWRCFI